MYVYFDYPAMSKIPKQLPNLTETSIILMDSMVSSITSTLILLPCLTIHSESDTRTALYHVHSYTVTVSYHSLSIRYQNSFIRSKTTNTEGPPLIESINIIYTIHINYSEACIKRSHLEQRKSGL
jgi:hypothetical protein